MDINPVDNPELFSDESRAGVIFAVASGLMALATTAVGLRFYTRIVVLGIVGFDDWLCLTTLVIFLTLGGMGMGLVDKGLGRHIGTLPQPNGFRDYMQTFYIVIIIYNLAIASFKLCFLAQYYRIMTSKKMRTMIYVAAGFVVAWTLSQLCLNIFQCKPISGFWEPGPGVECLPILPGWYINAAGNIIADVLILLLPLPMIRGLNLPRAQKLALVGIFCLGFLTCAISFVRLKYLPQGFDTTWDNVDALCWSLSEACTGLICVTLPTLRPLAIRFFPSIFKSSSARTGSSGAFGGSQWQPRDIETGRKIRSTVTTGTTTTNKRATKRWTTTGGGPVGGGGGDQETLVVRPGGEVWDNDNIRNHENEHENEPHAVSSHVAVTANSRRSRNATYLDMSSRSSSEEDGDIELRDVSPRGRRSSHLKHPEAVYNGGRARTTSIGNAVEISSGDDVSKPEKNLFIKVEREISIEGSSR